MPPPPFTKDDCIQFVETLLFPSPGEGSALTPGSIGIELENFCYTIENGRPSAVPLYGDNSLVNALLDVSTTFGGIPKYAQPETSGISKINKIEFEDGDSFLFEPGGQVEISTAPCINLRSVQEHLQSKQAILKEVTRQTQIHFGQIGTNPLLSGDELQNQLQSTRYIALENYFNSIGPYGRQMMMQTCGLHINLDAGTNDATRIKRIVAANLLVPFSTALFANSNHMGRRETPCRSYRSYIWQHTDNMRTGILPVQRILATMDRNVLIDAYLEFALNAPLIYIRELGSTPLPQIFTLKYWLENPIEGIKPNLDHIRNHFSLLFPEVRLKGYLELRSVDAPPIEWQMIPLLFYTGLLYSEPHLEKTLEILSPIAPEINTFYMQAVDGLTSDKVYHYAKNLIQMAIHGLSALSNEYIERVYVEQMIKFNQQFTSQRKTFADTFLKGTLVDCMQ